MHVFGDTEEVRIQFQNPYWRHASAVVHVQRGRRRRRRRRATLPGTPDTAFRREWKHFADCILNGATPRTPLRAASPISTLAVRIIRAMPPKPA